MCVIENEDSTPGSYQQLRNINRICENATNTILTLSICCKNLAVDFLLPAIHVYFAVRIKTRSSTNFADSYRERHYESMLLYNVHFVANTTHVCSFHRHYFSSYTQKALISK